MTLPETVTPADTYIPDDTYHALKAALAAAITVPPERSGCDEETFAIETLGEIGGIWPESVLKDGVAKERGCVS